MKAAQQTRYGGPEVVTLTDLPTPQPGPTEIRVRVAVSSVTTADWRMRAAAFPGVMWLPGRLFAGLWRPRQPIRGMEFAGTVEAVGAKVTRFRPGQRVFGMTPDGGAHAEALVLSQEAAVVATPAALADGAAAALPFGALCALVFLRDHARLRPGQEVLIYGASGGVGVYAVQIARAMGARVTAVASAGNAALLRDLGAHEVLDYRTQDPAKGSVRFDVVLDPVGVSDFARLRSVIRPEGCYIPLTFSGRQMRQALWARLRDGPRVVLAVNGDRAEDLEALLELWAQGRLRPVIDRRYALSDLRAAYRYVEGRHRRGAVLIDVMPPADLPCVTPMGQSAAA